MKFSNVNCEKAKFENKPNENNIKILASKFFLFLEKNVEENILFRIDISFCIFKILFVIMFLKKISETIVKLPHLRLYTYFLITLIF